MAISGWAQMGGAGNRAERTDGGRDRTENGDFRGKIDEVRMFDSGIRVEDKGLVHFGSIFCPPRDVGVGFFVESVRKDGMRAVHGRWFQFVDIGPLLIGGASVSRISGPVAHSGSGVL